MRDNLHRKYHMGDKFCRVGRSFLVYRSDIFDVS